MLAHEADELIDHLSVVQLQLHRGEEWLLEWYH